jgi:hypothetical protein
VGVDHIVEALPLLLEGYPRQRPLPPPSSPGTASRGETQQPDNEAVGVPKEEEVGGVDEGEKVVEKEEEAEETIQPQEEGQERRKRPRRGEEGGSGDLTKE